MALSRSRLIKCHEGKRHLPNTHLITLPSLQVRWSWVKSRHSTLSISCRGTCESMRGMERDKRRTRVRRGSRYKGHVHFNMTDWSAVTQWRGFVLQEAFRETYLSDERCFLHPQPRAFHTYKKKKKCCVFPTRDSSAQCARTKNHKHEENKGFWKKNKKDSRLQCYLWTWCEGGS